VETEFAARRRRIAKRLAERGLEALLVTSPANIRYLCGFTGSNGLLLVLPGRKPALFTDPRYELQAAQETGCRVRVVRSGPLAVAAAKVAARRKIVRIGFESQRVSFEAHGRLSAALPLGSSLEPVGMMIESERMVKSAGEIERIHRSAEANSEAFAAAVRKVKPGMSELELAAELDYQMRRRGAEQPAFETIVAFGARTALPHARPTSNRLSPNQLVLIDMGALRDGYASDMTRMLSVATPKPRLRRMYRAVLEAQLAALDAVRDGVTAESVDRRARQVLRGAGLEAAFVHSTGHGLGLEIHEAPRLGKNEKTRLSTGMVVTIEPGAYLEGLGGVRIEDTVAVTANGARNLTPTEKDLLVL
jgi:Xaa-Pro aminopeptidase